MRNVTTTTISLPKAMARRARQLSRTENRTISELFRESFRMYETTHPKKNISWHELQKRLKRISAAGETVDLAKAIARDRLSH